MVRTITTATPQLHIPTYSSQHSLVGFINCPILSILLLLIFLILTIFLLILMLVLMLLLLMLLLPCYYYLLVDTADTICIMLSHDKCIALSNVSCLSDLSPATNHNHIVYSHKKKGSKNPLVEPQLFLLYTLQVQ